MNILKSLIMISSMTFFSRILGFIRDIIIARIFGASIESDAFFVAFKIPNLLRRIFAEGAFSQAFIPILAEYKNQKKEPILRIFIANITGLLILALTLVTIIGILAAPWIIMITAPGFINTPEKFILTTELLRITFPYILFISLTSLVGAILNTWNYFSVPAFTPALLNISMISFAIIVIPLFNPPIMALSWAVVVGGILQLCYQLPYLKKINMLVLPIIKPCDDGIWRVLRQMGSAIFGALVSQISFIINTILASCLVSGSISWMYYADRLMEFPLGILGVALGTILLPLLSRSFSSGNYDEYSILLDWGLRLCFMLAIPSAIMLGTLAHPLIVVLFQYDNFSAFDTLMTQKVLITYSVGIVGLVLVKVLASGFYSRQNIKTPIRIAIITLFMTQLMNLIFINQLKHVGLSLSISLAAYLNAGLLYWQLRYQKIFKPQLGWLSFCGKLLLAAIIMTLVLIGLLIIATDWSQGSTLWRLIRLLSIITVSGSVYFIILWLVGLRVQHFMHLLLTHKS